MIGSLKGRLLAVEPPMILLDVHGVGFELQLPLSDLSDPAGTGRRVEGLDPTGTAPKTS